MSTLRLYSLLIAILILSGCANKEPVEQKPNILFIIADDLGARLACNEDPVALTPQLDELASRGVSFTNTFCQFYTCGPSRASMLSGLYPHQINYTNNGANGSTFNDKVPGIRTLPALLRENGYFTARVGKLFHMGIPGGIGKQGTDDTLAWDIAINNKGYDASAQIWNDATHVGNTHGMGVRVVYDALDISDEEMSDGQGLKAALKLMRENNPRNTGKPFFLAFGIYRPHPPLIVPEKHWDAIDMTKYQIPINPENDREDMPFHAIPLKDEGFNYIPEEHAKNYAHAYYASIHFVDELAGRLIQELEVQGLDDKTIIVFTGDQGFHLGEHGHWHKSTMFEEAFKVPLIIYDPRKKESGKSCTKLVGLIDLYPTLCELTGVKPEHRLSGNSLVPQLNDVLAKGEDFQLMMGRPDAYTLRTERYRYTEWKGEGEFAGDAMLYDLKQDPNEFVNQVDNPEYIKIKEELSTSLDGFIQQSLTEINGNE